VNIDNNIGYYIKYLILSNLLSNNDKVIILKNNDVDSHIHNRYNIYYDNTYKDYYDNIFQLLNDNLFILKNYYMNKYVYINNENENIDKLYEMNKLESFRLLLLFDISDIPLDKFTDEDSIKLFNIDKRLLEIIYSELTNKSDIKVESYI
jgi:hypothetical protein